MLIASGTGALRHTLVTLQGALLAPDLVSFTALLPIMPESGIEGLLAEVTELVHLLGGVGLVVYVLDEFEITVGDLPCLARIDKTKILAVFIAFMGIEEHEHAEVA